MRDSGKAQDNVIHPIPPVFDKDSEILILGSFPSVRSRETGFFYGHPQNRFWRVLAGIYGEPVPGSIPGKKAFLLKHHIAVWDVIGSCDITGSSDSSIRNVKPSDISIILNNANIRAVFTNGATASRMYNRYILPVTGREAQVLPSTSPANAKWSLDDLISVWEEAIRIPLPE